jgi:2-polyprenyl-3-methyl-5-hydroxy-6-metoxy-1,4-benzoquinol methylase
MKMQSKIKKYTEANREAWNEAMPRHQKAASEKWDQAFMQPNFVCMDAIELDLLKRTGIQNKAIAHLCCNNGIELLSLKNLGAKECTGFDISDLAIQEARERARLCHIDCEFIRTDVFEIGPEYENRYDLIYISAGGMGWLPDLKLFFGKAAAMLRENGQIFIHEIHPFCEMLPVDDAEAAGRLEIIEPYFKAEPYIEYGGLDYVGGSQYTSTRPQYWFVHKLSDILMGLIENQVSIQHFSEYEHDISGVQKQIEQAKAGIPLSYILIGKKMNHEMQY